MSQKNGTSKNGHTHSGLRTGLATGAVASAATTAAVMAAGQYENQDVWAAINSIAHMLFGQAASEVAGFDAKTTLSGLGLNAASVTGWGLLYEKLFGEVEFPRSIATGAAAATAIYLLDYYIFPKRFRPGIERKLDNKAVWFAYGVLGLSFALSPLWRRRK